jgi:hypothetical protein
MRLIRLIAPAAALAVALAFAGTAQASPSASSFRSQGRLAGLTDAQIAALQHKVDGYLAKVGGKQVALDTLELSNTATVHVALPGEAHPRDLGPLVSHCYGGADYHYFCAYETEGYTGDEIAMYNCASYNIGWFGLGSWYNNQTKGVRAKMYDPNGKLLYTTPGAPSVDSSGDWTPVGSVRNC